MVARCHSPRWELRGRPVVRKALLACGVVAFPFYVAMDVMAARRYRGYRYADQTISELSAIDSPTRSFWMPLGYLYSGLSFAYGLGVWAAAGRKRSLRAVGIMAAAGGLSGLVGWPFAPMHKREVLAAGGGTRSDTMHLALSGLSSVLFLLSIGLGATAFGRRFRRYSIATLLTVLAAGALTASKAPKVALDEPTPRLGIYERIVVFSPMLWYAVLAIRLLRAKG